MALRGDEDIRCHPGGWECYEEPGGIFYEGKWLTCKPVYTWADGEKRLLGFEGDAVDYYTSQPLTEYLEHELQTAMMKPYWVQLL